MLMTLRQLGGLVGVAALGSILNTGYHGGLDTSAVSPAVADAARDNVTSALAIAQKMGLPDLAHSAESAFIHQPAELSPVEALCAAVHQLYNQIPDSRIAMELHRNQLIMAEPELRRRALDEVIRPFQLLSEGLATRFGRDVHDPYAHAYAGAMTGDAVTAG